jgi:hypothetical protein
MVYHLAGLLRNATIFCILATEPPLSIAANMLAMEGLAEDHRLVKALVDWSGLAPSRVAAEIGAAATTITRPYKGQRRPG